MSDSSSSPFSSSSFSSLSAASASEATASVLAVAEGLVKPRTNGDEYFVCHESSYQSLLNEKVQKLKTLLPYGDVEVFDSPKTNFRMRANFFIWRDTKNNADPSAMYYAMCEPNNKNNKCEITCFPRGSVLMNNLMHELMVLLRADTAVSRILRENAFEMRIVTTLVGQAVIILIYRKPIPEGWLEAANEASKILRGVKIVGRSKKVVQVTGNGDGDELIEEVLTVNGKQFKYFQAEGSFSQPNAAVCEKMLTWACNVTRDSKEHDLLELYCGGGTFTAALSQNFRQVMATEVSKSSVQMALKTFAANSIDNVKVARLSSEEFTVAFQGNRNFERLQIAGISFKDYDIRTVFVDPPRAGLDEKTRILISIFERIVYISCNPETLARDVAALLSTHRIEKMAAFDQFPYTHHLESGVFLVRHTIRDLVTTSIGAAGGEEAATIAGEEPTKTIIDLGKRAKRKAEYELKAAESLESEEGKN